MLNSNAFVIACALCAACSSIKIQSPANGSKNLATPQELIVEKAGQFYPLSIQIDGQECQNSNDQKWELAGDLPLYFLDPGQHTIAVSAVDSGGTPRSATSTFSIASCPTCYRCPDGRSVHPILGQCCSGSSCDERVAGNFGPAYYPSCRSFRSSECIHQSSFPLCGERAGNSCPAEAAAVQFSPSRSGALSQVQVPIGHVSGTNSYVVSITRDEGGAPAAAPLETFKLTDLREQTNPVKAPVHLFSVSHPPLSAGAKYWLVVAPGGPDTAGSWNFAATERPAQSTNFLANTTAGPDGIPALSGPWSAEGLGAYRTAFEVDVR